MEQNNKRIAKNTLLLYIRLLISMIVSLYTSRIVLNALGIDDFGLYNVIGGVIVVLGFFNSSMLTATQRFLNYEMEQNNVQRLSKIFSTSLIGHFLIAAIILLLAETVGLWFVYNYLVIPPDRFYAALWVYHFSVFSFIVNIISSPYNAIIIAYERMSTYAYLSMLDVIFKLITAFLLIYVTFDKLQAYALLLFVSTAMVRSMYVFYCKRKFPECSFQCILDKNLLKRMFNFSGWMLLGTLTSTFSFQGVSIIINLFFAPAYNAARAIAQQVCMAVYNFANNFMIAVHPPIVKAYSRGDEIYMYKLVFFSSKISFYLLYALSLPIILQPEFLLTLWLKTVPEYTVLFTQLALIEILISSSYAPIAVVSQASGKIKYYQLIISIGFLSIFILTFLFYQLGFPAIVTYFISIGISIIGLIARLLELNKTVKFPLRKYLSEVTFRLIMVASLSAILPVICMHSLSSSLLHFSLIIIVSVVSVTLFFWLFALNHSEKKLVMNEIKTRINKK